MKASQVFPLYMLVNFTISRTNFAVVLASSCSEDKCQLGLSAHGARQIYKGLGAFWGQAAPSIT